MKQHDLLSGRQGRQLPAGFREVLFALFLAGAIAMPVASGKANASEAPDMPAPHSEIENRLGIEIMGLRRSAAGYMLDFRYRLIDPAKAAPLLDRKLNPYLLDEASGAQLGVPMAPKVGQLRPTSRNKVIPGRNYYILFANPGGFLKSGSQVALMLGDLKIEHLTVQ
jgi:hypothetical protein